MSGARVVGGRVVRPGDADFHQGSSFSSEAYPGLSSLYSAWAELPISPRGRRYLASVYSTVALTFAFAFVGAYSDLALHVGGGFSILASAGLVLAISSMALSPMEERAAAAGSSTPSIPAYHRLGKAWARKTKKSTWVQGVPNALILLCALGFVQGLSLRPLLEAAMHVNPLLIPLAILLTALLFACITLCALFVPKRATLALAALTSSSLTVMGCIWAVSATSYSPFASHQPTSGAMLALSMVGLCCYSLVDVGRLLDHAETGQEDVVYDGMMLFLHVLPVFVRILTYLTQQAQRAQSDSQQQKATGGRRIPPIPGVRQPMHDMANAAYQQWGSQLGSQLMGS